LADGAYHWRARVIDIFGNPSDWYYYGDSQNIIVNNWESPPINIKIIPIFMLMLSEPIIPKTRFIISP